MPSPESETIVQQTSAKQSACGGSLLARRRCRLTMKEAAMLLVSALLCLPHEYAAFFTTRCSFSRGRTSTTLRPHLSLPRIQHKRQRTSIRLPSTQRDRRLPSLSRCYGGVPSDAEARQHSSATGPLNMMAEGGAQEDESEVERRDGDEKVDPRLYSVKLSRVTGIDWGTDISFAWVYVRGMSSSGSAAECGEVSVGDQLIAVNDVNLAGAPFDVAMDTIIGLKVPQVEYTFFRGSTEDLKRAAGAEDPPEEITVTVKQAGKPEVTLKAASGTNLRNLLTDNGINVYQSVTRWTNCKGKQLCGTCIVEINEGLEGCTVRSIDESSTLRDNPSNYRLSCVTNMYDDVTVTVFPPVGAAQWTR